MSTPMAPFRARDQFADLPDGAEVNLGGDVYEPPMPSMPQDGAPNRPAPGPWVSDRTFFRDQDADSEAQDAPPVAPQAVQAPGRPAPTPQPTDATQPTAEPDYRALYEEQQRQLAQQQAIAQQQQQQAQLIAAEQQRAAQWAQLEKEMLRQAEEMPADQAMQFQQRFYSLREQDRVQRVAAIEASQRHALQAQIEQMQKVAERAYYAPFAQTVAQQYGITLTPQEVQEAVAAADRLGDPDKITDYIETIVKPRRDLEAMQSQLKTTRRVSAGVASGVYQMGGTGATAPSGPPDARVPREGLSIEEAADLLSRW